MKLSSTIQEIMTGINVKDDEWDLLLAGDGSGQGWDFGCGWGCVLVDHKTFDRKLFYGAMNVGTIGIAELFPYIHAMTWYSRLLGKKRLKELQEIRKSSQTLKVHIITDSEITAKQGNGVAKRETNAEFWASIDYFNRFGYSFKWHWLERDTIGLNALTDHISREARISLHGDLPEGSTIYDFSPSENTG